MSERALNATQRNALAMLWVLGDKGPTQHTEGSMPSLVKRGLVEAYRETALGCSFHNWRLTETGRAEAKRICAEARRAAEESRARVFAGASLQDAIREVDENPPPELTPEQHPMSFQFLGECLDRRDEEAGEAEHSAA